MQMVEDAVEILIVGTTRGSTNIFDALPMATGLETQVRELVINTLTKSPLTSELVVNEGLFVPAFMPLICH